MFSDAVLKISVSGVYFHIAKLDFMFSEFFSGEIARIFDLNVSIISIELLSKAGFATVCRRCSWAILFWRWLRPSGASRHLIVLQTNEMESQLNKRCSLSKSQVGTHQSNREKSPLTKAANAPSVRVELGFFTTKATGCSPSTMWGFPITHTSRTSGCNSATFSMSIGAICRKNFKWKFLCSEYYWILKCILIYDLEIAIW